MGISVLTFERARPDTDAGHNVALGQLEQLVARGQQAATVQREAAVDIRTAAAQKQDLRLKILSGPVTHMAEVGGVAAKENAELGKSFRGKADVKTYLALQTAGRTMLAAAEAHKDVLAKYGRSESVVAEFGQLLDQFDGAVTLGSNGRTARKGATPELRRVSTMIAQTVRIMDARNRQRFQDDPQALGEWLSARQVLGTPKSAVDAGPGDAGAPGAPAAPGAGGEVRPAA